MNIPIKLLSPAAIIPTKATPGSNAYDLYSIEAVDMHPEETKAICTGIAIEIPSGYVGLVCPRSGLAFKTGITVANAPGVIDSDYRGEVKVILKNHSAWRHDVNKNDRVGQILFVKTEDVTFDAVSELSDTSRGVGGFGSSGK